MPGYQLLAEASLRPQRAGGITPATEVLGILDFMRELNEDTFPFERFTRFRLVGIDDVLFAARPNERDIAIEIHRRLNDAAPNLQRRLMDIQVVFHDRIVRGAEMAVVYRGATLPIGLIFNHPPQNQDANGNIYYPMAFHLST